jgi:ABC-type sugar transport system permease subunit
MKPKRKGGIEAIKRRYGYYFVAPWIFGVIAFVLVPLITCFFYSLSDVLMRPEGLQSSYIGLKYYKRLFLEDPSYMNDMLSSMSSLFTSMPIVVSLSMILAIILNQRFRGRLLARAVFFLPVIIASGAVMGVLSSFGMVQEISASSGISSVERSAEFVRVIDFSDMLHRLNLPENVNNLIERYLYNTFNLIWSCGIQILLFVSGLQTIPAQLYEAGKVEGITPWEEFWYITVPMMGRVILLVMFYTMVDLFITKGVLVNKAIERILKQDYSLSSAMLWPYFAFVGLVIGMIIWIYYKLCLKKWE